MALPHEPLKGYLANVEAELSEAVRERESLRTQVERLRAALRLLAEDDTYLRHLSEWHDVGHMQRGIQAIARAALDNK